MHHIHDSYLLAKIRSTGGFIFGKSSHRLDFGKEWFGTPCSAQYWADVKPVFDYLKQEKSKKKNWSDILEKDEEVYVPLLQAFMDEIQRDYQTDASMPKKMVEYLIGTDDYYKIVSHDKRRMTNIQTLNLHDSLNQPGKKLPHHVPIVELPTELVAMRFKTGSKNTVEMYLNNGWQLNFRIYNASTKVEPSLKFDVRFIGVPASILNFSCDW